MQYKIEETYGINFQKQNMSNRKLLKSRIAAIDDLETAMQISPNVICITSVPIWFMDKNFPDNGIELTKIEFVEKFDFTNHKILITPYVETREVLSSKAQSILSKYIDSCIINRWGSNYRFKFHNQELIYAGVFHIHPGIKPKLIPVTITN